MIKPWLERRSGGATFSKIQLLIVVSAEKLSFKKGKVTL